MLVQGLNSDGEMIRDFYVERTSDYATEVFDDGVTRQEFADECDINVLMAQYERTGVLNHFNSVAPQYLDVSDVPDLQRSIAIVEAAETAFMTLPAKVRREFDNDAVKFVAFAQDPANLESMREWGLAAPEAVPDAPIRVEMVSPAVPLKGDGEPS
ncbi:internal scaffolding protein [Blackfly microvirus SF02]|uniref:Internal scaffolding protein n=1 Tax=Blackfly microvirus SF02 TaxID=2576452 RepID=A0A4P8PRT5_9VIRU|nr:internal scaffolding protein [Blackfly microvirus SF02]